MKRQPVFFPRAACCLVLALTMPWASAASAQQKIEDLPEVKGQDHGEAREARLETKDLGPLGTGSNMFRTGLVHSSGLVFIGTYGPAPAIIWKYDPRKQKLTKVGAPGEYQLDSMVEAPNGKVYIGTAYQGLVYELDPDTERIRSLGTPPVDSTPWIFTMVRTRDGDIYGAKGVGLFQLDWRTGKMESRGLVPGDHATPGPAASDPIVRTLEQRPDGLLWGDSNRWIFSFDPKTRKITPVADVVAYDDACYGVMHSLGESPFQDLYFQVYSRFSGRTPKRPFAVCRASTGKLEPLAVEGLQGKCWPCGWWKDGPRHHWLVAQFDSESGKSSVAVVDVLDRRVIERWAIPGREMPPARLAGPGLWFIATARGTLYRAEPERKQLVPMCVNPEPVACRCLAASPLGQLGAYTYDCGFAFTLDLKSGKVADHGRVDFDDHRCVFGPAVFAGKEGRYLVANRGDVLPRLGVSDLEANCHWTVGDTAIQLVRMSDGTVWGTQGALHGGHTDFTLGRSWEPAWAARPGKLFRYRPGKRHVDVIADMLAGPLAEAPGRPGSLLIGLREKVFVFDPKAPRVVAEKELPAAAAAVVTDMAGSVAYLVLVDGSLWSCWVGKGEQLTTERLASDFGTGERGCFLLPRSRRLIGIGPDGTVSVFDPHKKTVARVKRPVPLAAGPAVHPGEDVWYFADRHVLQYALSQSRAR